MFNTPPVFPIYMLGKVLKWMRDEGGVSCNGAPGGGKGRETLSRH